MFFKIICAAKSSTLHTHTCKNKMLVKNFPMLLKLLNQNIQQVWVQGTAIYPLKVNFPQKTLSSIRTKGRQLLVWKFWQRTTPEDSSMLICQGWTENPTHVVEQLYLHRCPTLMSGPGPVQIHQYKQLQMHWAPANMGCIHPESQQILPKAAKQSHTAKSDDLTPNSVGSEGPQYPSQGLCFFEEICCSDDPPVNSYCKEVLSEGS